MKTKIFRQLFLCCALTALLVSLLISYVMYHGYTRNIQNSVMQTANDYKNILNDAEIDNIEALEHVPNSIFRITLISPEGEVLFDNQSETTEDHSNRPEIIAAIQSGTGSATRFSDTLQEQTHYYARLLDSENVIRISAISDTAYNTFLDSLPFVLISFVVVLTLSYIISRGVTNKLIQPINSINVEQPTKNNTYVELTPLLIKIENQNSQLMAQTTDMQKMRDELSGIMNYMEEGLIVLSGAGKILSINQAALAITKKTAEECVGRYILEIHRGEKYEKLFDLVERKETGSIYLEENDRVYRVSVSFIKSGGSIILFVDVTQQHDAEKMRREFSANVSHELKTPLQTISGYAELLSNNMVQEDDKPRFIEKIYNESMRMSLLIQDIIKLSHLDEELKGVAHEEVLLNIIVAEVVDELTAKAEKKQVAVGVLGADVNITGIPTLLKECLFNVVDNAIEYNKDGGKVDIDIRLQEKQVVISVSDTGIGIPADEQQRVFERFYRVEKSRCRSNGGTGLGLSIVKHAVSIHAGEIELISEEGKGTTVKITIPKT